MKHNSISENRISNFNSINSTVRVTAVILSYSLAVIGSHSILNFFFTEVFSPQLRIARDVL